MMFPDSEIDKEQQRAEEALERKEMAVIGYIGRGIGDSENVFFIVPDADLSKFFESIWIWIPPCDQRISSLVEMKPGQVVQFLGVDRPVFEDKSEEHRFDEHITYLFGDWRFTIGKVVGELTDSYKEWRQ